MDIRIAIVAMVAAFCGAEFAHGAEAAYGNPSGCAASRDDWDNASDLMLLVRGNEIDFWESACTLPDARFDGADVTARCLGEGEAWTIQVSLTVPDTRPDIMIYVELDPQTGRPVRTDELWRCQALGP